MSLSRHSSALAAFLLCGTAPVALAMQDGSSKSHTASETVLFSADRVIRERADSPIIAEGNVRAFFGQQALLADELTYDPENDIVRAKGNVSIFDADGQTYYADDVELSGDLRDGVATNFSALIGKQSRLAGSSVVRRSSGQNDLNNAAFTACSVCQDDGSKKTPTWSVKALKVTQDTEAEMIHFRNATINVFGVPVFYTPYMAFPDPSVKRKSGFLAPSIASSSRLGVEVEVPYYFAISDHQDFTFAPRVFTKLGVLIKGEYRIRSHDAGAVVQAGIINAHDSPDDETPNDPNDLLGPRWHIFANAFKELENDWRADVNINYVSDKRYLRTYDIQPERDLRKTIDFFRPDRLENELSFSRKTKDSYTDITALMFQSLRLNDLNDFMANALPHIQHSRTIPTPMIGGETTYSADFLYLHRTAGLDSARLSGAMSYENTLTSKRGHRLRGFGQLRGDYYRYTDANLGVQSCNVADGDNLNGRDFATCRQDLPRNAQDENFSTTRLLPTAGIEWSYPLAKYTTNTTIIIEPKVQLVVSPKEDFREDIVNEDSQFYQFDTANLFDWNKSTGLDAWEDGTRLNVGITARADYENGLRLAGSFGQQFRASESVAFDPDTGLGDNQSDYVADLDIAFGRRFSLDNSFRFDSRDATVRRAESTFRGRMGKLATSVSYLRAENLTDAGNNRDEFLTAAASYQLTPSWLIGGTLRENLEAGETTNRSVLLQYRDDCTIFSLRYRFDDALGTGREDNTSLTFNVEIAGF